MAECPCTPADDAGLVEVFWSVDIKQFSTSQQACVGETAGWSDSMAGQTAWLGFDFIMELLRHGNTYTQSCWSICVVPK